ncbi:MAG: glycine cleavage system aminomethyltransferase GcvT [Candidatus Nanopelagicales bacterium]
MTELKYTPLHDRHAALGAKLVDFTGWEMPIEYQGIVAEHAAVREAVGIFDVSHMGKLRIRGEGALEAVNAIVTNDINRLADGQAQYSLLCNESGGAIDDLIVYRRSAQEIRIVPNAGNADVVAPYIAERLPAGVSLENRHYEQGILAIQGPQVDGVMQALGLPHAHEYMSFVDAEFDGAAVMICRTGYTGERGFELVTDNATIVKLWDAATAAGAMPVGLGARDTLRTEMGYALHGQELSTSITPVQARVGWAVGWSKPRFSGREALLVEKAAGPQRTLRGLLALERGIPRGHMSVYGDEVGGTLLGETTSGTFSPTLKQGIALAYLDSSIVDGAQVVIDVRGRSLLCEVVRPPFVKGTSVNR